MPVASSAWSRAEALSLVLFSSPPAGGCCPAFVLGRLRGWRQGVRGACPSTPPTTPVLPLVSWRREALSYHVYPVRRSPQGAVGRIFPSFARAICAPAAALPRCGDRLRAPARWFFENFSGLCVERQGVFPLGGAYPLMRRLSSDGDPFSSLFRWLAASARHRGVVASRRGAGGERGVPLYAPYDPRTPPCLVEKGGAVVSRVPCPPLAAGGKSARIFPSFARAICAPAAALPRCGDRLRAPARWVFENFSGLCVERQGVFPLGGAYPLMRRLSSDGELFFFSFLFRCLAVPALQGMFLCRYTESRADSHGDRVQSLCWRYPHTTEKAWFFRVFGCG